MPSYEHMTAYYCIHIGCRDMLIVKGGLEEERKMLIANGWREDPTYAMAHSGNPGYECPKDHTWKGQGGSE